MIGLPSEERDYDYSELSDLSDDELRQLSQELESQPVEGAGLVEESPTAERKDSWLVFAREINKSRESTKVANLDNTDLVLVRGNLRIANFCDVVYKGTESTTLRDYFRNRAEILLGTSMSKKAKFLELLVTQIKKQQTLKPPTMKKRTLFGGVKEVPVPEGET